MIPDIGTSGSSVACCTADVLLVLTGSPTALGVSEIARQVGCSKSAAHRVLKSLASRGFVEQGPGRAYRLGPAAVAMGSRSLARAQLESVAAPTLVSLRNVTSETALLARPVAGGRVFVAQFESVHEMHMKADLGTVFPWYAGASGKAMLAYLDEPVQEQILELAKGEDGLSEQRVVELSAELEMIRALGYAVSIGDPNSLAAAVAAPVVDPNGTLVAAISVCAPIARFSSHMLTERASLVIRAANEVSRRMQLMAS